ncbi:MAG TPA: sugar-binding protein [Mobilitalea sp.]|nr:sugar-binding protein [Mobilitalea sp.]
MKKLCVLVLGLILVFSMAATASADANASWNAGKGTAVVDGQKDDVYAGAQEMKMSAVSDVLDGGTADDTAASAWAVYDNEAIYIFVEVSDSALDDTNANVWEKDSIELRIDNKDQLVQAYAVSETVDGTAASESKVLKTDKGYNVEFKIPYATAEGSSMKFSLQVNCASDGARNHTLHTSEDLKDAWQNNDVFENLVFSADAATTAAATTDAATGTDVPKTGVVSMDVLLGMGSLASMVGLTLCKGKKIKK